MKYGKIFVLCAALLLLQACATKKQTSSKATTDTSVSDTKVNSRLTDITTVKPKEVKLTVGADSSEAVFQLPKGTKAKPLANLPGRRSEVASVDIDTAGILRVRCRCKEEELRQTIYELERTITDMRDSVSKSERSRAEIEKKLEVIEKKKGPLEWIKERIGGLVILLAILIALALGLKFAIKGRP